MTERRLPTLDGLRGLAVMGILLMNVTSFALPSGAYFNPAALGPPSPADLAAWGASFVLVDGKMRALFSILFGASTVMVVARAEADGRNPVRVHMARMGVLAVFGIAHGVLLWPGDILLHYAIVGVVALPLTQVGPRRLIHVALLLLAAQALFQAMLLLGDVQLRAAAEAGGAAAGRWHQLTAGIGVGRPADILAEIARQRGPWAPLVAANAHAVMAGAPFLLVFDGPETLAYMAIGMAALRSGLLAGQWAPQRAAALSIGTLAIGLPLSVLLAVAVWASGFDTLATFAAATLGGVALRPLIAIGYLAAVVPWLARGGIVQAHLRAAGRMAFSNYLLTSLLFCWLFDGWGLGLFARLPRAALLPPVLLAWALMLTWSAPWLTRFRYGPLEWLWRSAARGRLQPFTK